MAILVEAAQAVGGCARMKEDSNFSTKIMVHLLFIYAYVHTQLGGMFIV
jgi:hypothetical protein